MLTHSAFHWMPPVSRVNKARPKPMVAPAAQALVIPLDSVADGDMHAFILKISLLISDKGDQFFVETTSSHCA